MGQRFSLNSDILSYQCCVWNKIVLIVLSNESKGEGEKNGGRPPTDKNVNPTSRHEAADKKGTMMEKMLPLHCTSQEGRFTKQLHHPTGTSATT
jgi:hypothetical protein